MKKGKILLLLLGMALSTSVVACDNSSQPSNSGSTSTETDSGTGTKTDTGTDTKTDTGTGTETDTGTGTKTDTGTGTETDTGTDTGGTTESDSLAQYKNAALAKLDEIVNPIIASITNEDLKASVQTFYNTEKAYVNGITDLETAKAAAAKVVEDSNAFAVSTLKPLVLTKLNAVINPLIAAISYDDLKTSVQTYYDSQIELVDAIDEMSDVPTTFSTIYANTQAFIKSETAKVLVELKNKALETLDPYATALIAKIPFEDLKTSTQAFYTEEKAKLEAVTTIEGINPCVEEIKEDLEEFAITESKKLAIAKLDEVITAGLAKLPNETLKADLIEFKTAEIAKINEVTSLENVKPTLTTVLDETEAHIKELLVTTVKGYIARLTAVESATAYDYIPEAMNPKYAANLVESLDINYDFTSFTNVSDINKAGYGDQWQMVVENINQSISMASIFNIAQTVLNAAGNAVDIYIENSYSEEMNHTFTGDNFNGVFKFDGTDLIFNINITKEFNVPGIGTVTPIIKMQYNLEEDAKGMYISLGDAFKAKYVVRPEAYELATTYGITVAGQAASRTSYLSISKTETETTGHIYEYTTLNDSDKIKACADFYVKDGYVSVVGNKASGMVGFDGYINELYSATEGRLLGFEVREELEFYGVTGTYNTLWFNLWDVSGINSVKVTDKTDTNKSSKSTVDVYLNGSTSLLVPAYNKKALVTTSRKYDIEYRSRYYYTYDSTNEVYVVNEVKVPMLFVQEGDNYESFTEDFKTNNNIDATISIKEADLNKILSDYDTLIDVFIRNKELMTSELIIQYLTSYE